MNPGGLFHVGSVEEKKRPRALHQNVVHAVVDEIAAHGVHDSGLEREPQLGAHPVRAGNEYRFAILFHVQLEQRAKTAESREHFGTPGAARDALDIRDQRIAGVDIDARILVGEGLVAGIGHAYFACRWGGRF